MTMPEPIVEVTVTDLEAVWASGYELGKSAGAEGERLIHRNNREYTGARNQEVQTVLERAKKRKPPQVVTGTAVATGDRWVSGEDVRHVLHHVEGELRKMANTHTWDAADGRRQCLELAEFINRNGHKLLPGGNTP